MNTSKNKAKDAAHKMAAIVTLDGDSSSSWKKHILEGRHKHGIIGVMGGADEKTAAVNEDTGQSQPRDD